MTLSPGLVPSARFLKRIVSFDWVSVEEAGLSPLSGPADITRTENKERGTRQPQAEMLCRYKTWSRKTESPGAVQAAGKRDSNDKDKTH